ncbi:phage baseplate assembly protein V [Pseudomonas putida CSV86]|uniref:Phage baseplate assembly protein V n=1 Tax=Pseudomonas bharatica CSV86 TaxID=1005395 RepID=L1LUI1_9PSED|nr:phage baseplate assembly protein V [Pseudomonas bharatica]NNJ15445.1 phage baseplate assembly protein V [Pseudomonas bharatica CSV86]
MGVELEYGEVSAVDYMTCRIRVRLDDRDGVESYWLNVPQRNSQGTKRRPLMPEIGEQVAVLLDADGVGGVCLGGIYSTAEPPPVVDQDTDYVRYSDGTVVSYNRALSVMTVECVGDTLLKCVRGLVVESTQSVVIKAPVATLEIPLVTVKGNLRVTGDIHADGAIMDTTGNSSNHKH